jgi:RluA family pseudouridine synthase
VAGAAEEGVTLLEFLVARTGRSRRRVKHWLDARRVFVNRHPVWMARHRIRRGDTVHMAPPRGAEPAASPDIPILFDDTHYLVADKPPGMESNGRDSVESRLRAEPGLDAVRAVHRLDRDTSGCLILARTAQDFDAIVERFRRHDVRKTYCALVRGPVRPRRLEITVPIEGKTALTVVRVVDANRRASHLEVEIKTGRTHQIRRHLAGLGHPILGDRHYGSGLAASDEAMAVHRPMLHAARVEFAHPRTGRPVDVRSPCPPDFLHCRSRFGLR